MPYYLVTKPCKYISGGKPYYHPVGAVVELDNTVASYLVRNLKPAKAPKVNVEEKYGALASYVDPLLARETDGIQTVSKQTDTESLKKGEDK